MKKILAILLSLLTLLSCGLLSACSAEKTQPDTPDTETVWETVSEAYIYAFPLVLTDATKTLSTNTDGTMTGRAPINQFNHAKKLADASFRTVVTPNVDTVYSQAWLDISTEPMVYVLPKLCWRHGKHLVHGNKVIFLFISSLRCGILASLYISRKRQELHLLLNGIDIGQILVPGQHRAGDRPHRCGGHVHARHTDGPWARVRPSTPPSWAKELPSAGRRCFRGFAPRLPPTARSMRRNSVSGSITASPSATSARSIPTARW